MGFWNLRGLVSQALRIPGFGHKHNDQEEHDQAEEEVEDVYPESPIPLN